MGYILRVRVFFQKGFYVSRYIYSTMERGVRMRKKLISIFICTTLFLSFFIVKSTQTVRASTIIVPDDYPTIQLAINAANSGDTIYVRAGTYYEHLTIDKALTLQGEDKDTTVIDAQGTNDVIYVSADWVNISNFKITGSGPSQPPGGILDAGIEFDYTEFSSIINCNVSKNTFGIILHKSNNNTINKNTCTDNEKYGIHLYSASSYNTVSFNTVIGPGPGPASGNIIIASGSQYNKIHNNYCSNAWDGIYLIWYCNFNLVYNNTCTKNRNGICPAGDSNTYFNNYLFKNEYGIFVNNAGKYNIIRNNNISENSNYGIHLYSKDYNLIYHNNFINNLHQARDKNGVNHWDNGYPTGGNYWSDYTGVDNNNGPNQDIPGSDGIGDTPYINIEGDRDNYPLMYSWNDSIVTTINIDPNTLNLKSKGRWITCYINLNNPYDVNDIDISTILLEDTIPAEWGDIQNNTLMIKYDRSDVEDMFPASTYNMKVTGELTDGTSFEGYSDEIRVIDPGK
jgi:parallel beta-helix repeat protein